MKTLELCAFALAFVFAGPAAISQEIQRLDPALSRLVPASAKLERVATGFDKWTEGPAWTREASLLFAVIPANRIMIWSPGKGAEVFMEHSGYAGPAPYGGPEPG